MTREEYNKLFHELELNLVAFKQLNDCDQEVLKLVNAAIAAKSKPMPDEQLRKIIEEQAALTGWKVPPTIQVARAVEKWHGIGEGDDA